MSVYHRLALEEHVLTFRGISLAIVQQATDLLQEHVKVGCTFTNICIAWINNMIIVIDYIKQVYRYDQKVPQSQTADKPTTL